MRVLILSQWFTPEPNPISAPLAKGLKELGHEVEVLTGFPNYPGGKLYPGYKIRAIQRESIDGIPVTRVPLYPSHDNSGVKRALNYFSFAASASTIGASVVKRPDVVYVYHPPATVGLAAEMFRILRRVPFVYHIQDLWPDTLTATGMVNNNTVLKLINRLCRHLYLAAREIIVLSPGFKRVLIERGIAEEKIHVIYNWSEEFVDKNEPLDRDMARILEPRNKFRVVFAGNMGKAQGLNAVIDAARLIMNSSPSVEFVFIGDGIAVDELKDYAASSGVHNVRFIPRQPRTKINSILALADVLLVHLTDDPLFSITVPSKTQAYLAVGKPILMGVRGDAAQLIETAGAGLTCEPENPRSIAEAVIRFQNMKEDQRNRMAENGRAFYLERLSLRRGIASIERILDQAARN